MITNTATAHALNALSVNNDDLLRQTNEISHERTECGGKEMEVENPPESNSICFFYDIKGDIEDWRLEWLLERLEIEDVARDERHEADDVSADGLVESCKTAQVVIMDKDGSQCADVSSGSGVWYPSTFTWAITHHSLNETHITAEGSQAWAVKAAVEESNRWRDEMMMALFEGSGRSLQPQKTSNTANDGEVVVPEPIVVTEMAEKASDDGPLGPREPPVAKVKEGTGSTQEGDATSLSGHDDDDYDDDELAREELSDEAEGHSEVGKDIGVVEGEPAPSPFGTPIAIEDFEDLRALLQQHDLALGRDRHRLYRSRH